MIHIRQQGSRDCALACLQMVTDAPREVIVKSLGYDPLDATPAFDLGISDPEMLILLDSLGFGVTPRWTNVIVSSYRLPEYSVTASRRKLLMPPRILWSWLEGQSGRFILSLQDHAVAYSANEIFDPARPEPFPLEELGQTSRDSLVAAFMVESKYG